MVEGPSGRAGGRAGGVHADSWVRDQSRSRFQLSSVGPPPKAPGLQVLRFITSTQRLTQKWVVVYRIILLYTSVSFVQPYALRAVRTAL